MPAKEDRVPCERGTLQPSIGGGGREPDAPHLQRLADLVEQQPDATLAELCDRLHGAELHGAEQSDRPVLIAIIDRWCRRLGLRAAEQDRDDVKQPRATWYADLAAAGIAPQDIVALDEFAATTCMTRLRWRCKKEKRLDTKLPRGHWKVLTAIVAMTVGGMLAMVPVDAATDADVLRKFVE